MKLIGILLMAGVLLSLLQAALSVLVVVGVIVLVIGVFCRPAETFGLLLFGAFAILLQTHPVGCIWVMSLMLLVTLVKGDRGKLAVTDDNQPPLALTDAQLSAPED